MQRVRSNDAEIAFEVLGSGPSVVLLHPFPAHHELWKPASQPLLGRYQLVLPDLRGHGESEVGEGPALMVKHAADVARVLDAAGIEKAVLAGVSIGGYVLFEFWRRYRERVSGLALVDTKAQADNAEGRESRLRSAADVMERGTEPFIDAMLPRLVGASTRRARPDLVESARTMMLRMSPEDIAQVQRGMAERPDSVATLKTIDVPVLIAVGDEDELSPVADAELMRQNISRSQLKVVPGAGHYAVWEKPDEMGRLLRQFVDSVN
jgi:pimeloyl-ACP methyl ester carboxylesterase